MSRLLLALVLCVACGRGPTLPDQTTTSQWVKYHHWEDEPPCPAALSQLDELIGFISTTFGFTVAPIDYFKFRPGERSLIAGPLCVAGGSSCTSGSQVYTRGWAHFHETVHAAFAKHGEPPKLFIEGTAMVLGCGTTGYAGATIDTAIELERLISSSAWDADRSVNGAANQDAAGSFVRWLIDAKGATAYGTFYKAAKVDGDELTLQTFRDTFGFTYPEAVAQWRAAAPSPVGSFCLLPNDPCKQAAALPAGAMQPLNVELTCVPTVVTVGAQPGDALAVAVASSLQPIALTLESCAAQPEGDPIIVAPEAYAGRMTPLEGKTSLGKDVELRAFGFGTLGRLRIVPVREEDLTGALADPQSDTFGGAYGGMLTARPIAQPAVLFSTGCPGTPLPLGSSAWALQVSAPISSIPTGGGTIVVESAPFNALVERSHTAPGTFRCGSSCATTGCPNGPAPQRSVTVTRPNASTFQRFSVGWTLDR